MSEDDRKGYVADSAGAFAARRINKREFLRRLLANDVDKLRAVVAQLDSVRIGSGGDAEMMAGAIKRALAQPFKPAPHAAKQMAAAG